MQVWSKAIVPGIVMLVLCTFALLAISQLDTASKNIELLQVFNLDEGAGTWQLLQNVNNRDFDPRGFFNYGYFYINSTHLLVKAFGFLGVDTSDEQLIAVCLRAISFMSWMLSGLFIFLTCRRLNLSLSLSVLCGAAILLSPGVFTYAQMVHPDLLQMCLCCWAVYYLSKPGIKPLEISSSGLILGLAFGTKYSGIFLLSIPAFILLFQFLAKEIKLKQLLAYGMLCLVFFLFAWIASNPYVISDWSLFVEDFQYESQHVARGHWRAESNNPLLWLSIFWDQLGPILILGILSALGFFVWREKLGLNSNHRYVQILLIAFILGLAYLMIQVNMRRPRYLFHLLPLLMISGFYGLQLIKERVKKPLIISLVLLIALAFPIVSSSKIYSELSQKMEHPYVKAGEWMAKEYEAGIKILSDYYSYVPKEHFTNAYHTFGITQSEIEGHRPALIVLNKSISGMRSWKLPNTEFSELKIEATDRDGSEELNAFHLKLFSPNSTWKVVYEELNIVILEKELKNIEPNSELP